MMNDTIIPIAVDVSLRFLRVMDINEDENTINFQFEIILEWRDYRISYRNLKNQAFLNTLTQENIESIWLPLVVYDNTDQKETTRLGAMWEWSTTVTVTREGEFTRSGMEEVDEVEAVEDLCHTADNWALQISTFVRST